MPCRKIMKLYVNELKEFNYRKETKQWILKIKIILLSLPNLDEVY